MRKSAKKPRSSYAPIGVDGEGEDGRYTLLAASSTEGFEAYIEDREGLDTQRCLEFLLALPAKPYVFGFAFSYDVNMILVSLNYDELFTLAQWGRLYWGDWRIEHVPGKALTITHRPTKRSRTVWDLFPWIQSSFVNMLEDFGLSDEITRARVRAMKDKREDFRDLPLEQIRTYCVEECRLLASAVRLILDLMVESGYTTTVFYSPGSLAASVMKKNEIEEYRLAGPGGVLALAIEESYVGARAESSVVGPVEGPLYEYDINSAYPYAATNLACFAHGTWGKMRVKDLEHVSDTTLVRVRWETTRGAIWGPFPVRPRVGSLRFPTSGEAWIWGREARIGATLCKEFEILEGWKWRPSCDHKPFAYLGEIYEKRRALKDEGNGLEYVLKLILNSTYGKLAQRPYGDTEPRWRFLPWAGLITSETRAMLLEQIVAVGAKHVLLCATDCLVTDRELDVEISGRLGAWSVNEYQGLFVAGPGFYEAAKRGKDPKVRNRGISRTSVSFADLRAAWKKDGREGKVKLRTRRFIGYRQALQYRETEKLWRQFIDVPVVKQMTLEPRREWVTKDVHDGRSKAPSAQYIERHELVDVLARVQAQRLAGDESVDPTVRLMALEELRAGGIFSGFEQPDWLIEEFQHG